MIRCSESFCPYGHSQSLAHLTPPTTAVRPRTRRCSTPGQGRGPSSSARGCLPRERATRSCLWNVAGFPCCAPGSAGPSTFNGTRITSSRKASWIIPISLDRGPSVGEKRTDTGCRHRLPAPPHDGGRRVNTAMLPGSRPSSLARGHGPRRLDGACGFTQCHQTRPGRTLSGSTRTWGTLGAIQRR